jgi:hypothetical protein
MGLVSKTVKCTKQKVITLDKAEGVVIRRVREWQLEEAEVAADMVEELVEEETMTGNEHCSMALMPRTQIVHSPVMSGTNLDQMGVHMLCMRGNV